MSKHKKSQNHRDLPAYTIPEASHYLNIPDSTVRYWVTGKGGEYAPVIVPASDGTPTLLSFLNLVEIHLLGAITKKFKVKLPKVRSAVRYLLKNYGNNHPLLSEDLLTDGASLIIDKFGEYINISKDGQREIKEFLSMALERIELDSDKIPVKLYPFTHSDYRQSPRVVVIQPGLAFGRPVIAGTGIPTEIIAERYKAGDSVKELSEDYGRRPEEIEEAIRCELRSAA
jgi:uncharacterized protein (DUF433 family)